MGELSIETHTRSTHGGYEWWISGSANGLLAPSAGFAQANNQVRIYTDQAIVLVSGFEMSISQPTNLITMSFSPVPSIAGVMAIVNDGKSPATNTISPIYPSTGDFAVPVFSVSAPVEVLPVNGKSWGGVKSLFR